MIILNKPHTIKQTQTPDKSISVSNVDSIVSSGGCASVRNTTGIVSKPVNTTLQQKKIASNKRKWQLKRYAEQLMPGTRTSYCMRHLGRSAETVDLYYDDNLKNAHYQGLAHCDKPWACPVCSATLSASRAKEVLYALDRWHGASMMLTYTMHHDRNMKPHEMVKQLRNALRKLYKDRWGQKFKKYIGWHKTITALDITYHDRNGWHIHIHQLVLLDPSKTIIDVMDDEIVKRVVEAELKPQWIKMLQYFGADADYEHGLQCSSEEQFRREYIAKFGKVPEEKTWTVAHELTLSTSKRGKHKVVERGLHPFEILEKSEGKTGNRWAYLWSEYIAFTFRRNQLTWAPGLKAEFGIDDLTDEQVLDADDDEVQTKQLVYVMPYILWEAVLHFDERAKVLNRTIRYAGDSLKLEAYFKRLWRKYEKYWLKKNAENKHKQKEWEVGTIWDKSLNFD